MTLYLQIIIDTTGSMDVWICRLRESLYEFIKMCNFINFEQINIIEYKDYDVSIPVKNSGWHNLTSLEIEKFCATLQSGGGGNFCECFKTAIQNMLSNLPETYDKNNDKIYVLHITDSTPHNNETNIEEINDKIDWTRMKITGDITSPEEYKKTKMCKLDREGIKEKRALKEKFIWQYTIDSCLEHNIVYNSLTTFLDYLGCQLVSETKGYGICMPAYDDKVLINVFESWFSKDCFGNFPELVNNFEAFFNNIGIDEEITNKVFLILENIIDINIMLLTYNKIFSKVWRKVCKLRKHSSRKNLIDKMCAKKNLLNPMDNKVFSFWIKDSYNNIDEINETLKEIDCYGTITYVPDIKDNFSSQDIIKLFQDINNNNQLTIKQFVSRLYINTEKTILDKTDIPLNMSDNDIFTYLLHTVNAGTLLNSMLMKNTLAILCRNTVLDKIANNFLSENRGKWLNFDFSTEENLYPELFNVAFLFLLKKNSDILTTEESEIVLKLLHLNNYKKLKKLNLPIEYHDIQSLNKTYPDYVNKCETCNVNRPLSLLPTKEKCAYCINNISPKTVQTTDETYMVCCTKCNSFYSRDKSAYVEGNALCHACFNNETPSFRTCNQCNHNFIMYQNMPYGMCKNCLIHKSPRKFVIIQKEQILSNVFNDKFIFSMLGYILYNNKSLYNMYRTSESLTKNLSESYFYHGKKIINMNMIIEQINNAIKNNNFDYVACDICCDSLTNIMPACGRSKCTQKLCNTCGTNWFGDNEKGKLLNLRHLTCMFCNRNPTCKTMKRWGSDGISLMQNLPEISNANYYAWCIKCNGAKICGARECGDAPPNLTNYICDDCTDPTANDFKNCPSCNHPTVLTSGCNHITCPCGAHWCFECGGEFNSSTIYNHMQREHGGIYRNVGDMAYAGYDSDYESDY